MNGKEDKCRAKRYEDWRGLDMKVWEKQKQVDRAWETGVSNGTWETDIHVSTIINNYFSISVSGVSGGRPSTLPTTRVSVPRSECRRESCGHHHRLSVLTERDSFSPADARPTPAAATFHCGRVQVTKGDTPTLHALPATDSDHVLKFFTHYQYLRTLYLPLLHSHTLYT